MIIALNRTNTVIRTDKLYSTPAIIINLNTFVDEKDAITSIQCLLKKEILMIEPSILLNRKHQNHTDNSML